jgi:hypothetical protein
MEHDAQASPPDTLRLFPETWGLYALAATPSLIFLGCDTLVLVWYGIKWPLSFGHILLGLLYAGHFAVLSLPYALKGVYMAQPIASRGDSARLRLFLVLIVLVINYLISTIVLWYVTYNYFCPGCYFG